MFDHQGPVQAATEGYDRDGDQPAQGGRSGLGGARLHLTVQAAGHIVRPDSLPARRWAAEPAGGQYRDQVLGRS